MYLHRIVFYSKNNIVSAGVSMKELTKDILDSCARYDRHSTLTGALLFNEEYFVQVMEGHRDQISEKMWSLAEDRRHSSMVILGSGRVDRRKFLTWSVGFAGHSEEIDALYLQFCASRTLDPTTMAAECVVNLMSEFVHGDHGQFVKHASHGGSIRAA
jgi:hypothetical protein